MSTTKETEAAAPEPVPEYVTKCRLSIPDAVRIPLASSTALLIGFTLGMSQGIKTAGMRFRAEHAHKLPTTKMGWYFYHKSKNYNSIWGGAKEGARMGAKICFWTTAMFGIEHMFDAYRGTADIFNTVTACVTVAGAFSLWNRFSLPMAARTTKTALVVGLAYGGLQDVAGIARGRPIGYVEFLKRRVGGFKNTADENQKERVI
ncbi:hypothetical protein GE21DRAFT_2360 [Neurospora crassa]|uniref:Uncharacterized protein n=1 Tax=Neurospora crassa (strain ATCC 24698 / 74-OR23-1A / CBS 708.71 / DSM 1257 / FGSC 987) TaxID=367110 RepID=Q7SHG7_NEUCR|nr:hypothetical protein NCU02937 [Neurospora crassa OR74A]EAA36383.1 hypothetical protein NCU02937 [Neurospora crassa OR74A]KHE89288.1 hypothetical protein GE21DRAFT_2360 [Neurospora crassa]|eukprot:XP_965619.1 hypothetical protein NCU02937 [Neurospora crassa OR74A]